MTELNSSIWVSWDGDAGGNDLQNRAGAVRKKVQLTTDVERGHILLALINKTWLTEILWLSRWQHEAINHRLLPALVRIRIRVC